MASVAELLVRSGDRHGRGDVGSCMARGAGLDSFIVASASAVGPPQFRHRALSTPALRRKSRGPTGCWNHSILPPQPGPRTRSRWSPPHRRRTRLGQRRNRQQARHRNGADHTVQQVNAHRPPPLRCCRGPTPCTAELLLEIAKRITHERDSPARTAAPTRYEPVADRCFSARPSVHEGEWRCKGRGARTRYAGSGCALGVLSTRLLRPHSDDSSSSRRASRALNVTVRASGPTGAGSPRYSEVRCCSWLGGCDAQRLQ